MLANIFKVKSLNLSNLIPFSTKRKSLQSSVVTKSLCYLPLVFMAPGAGAFVPVFLLRRELKKFARTPSFAPATPGFVDSICQGQNSLILFGHNLCIT